MTKQPHELAIVLGLGPKRGSPPPPPSRMSAPEEPTEAPAEEPSYAPTSQETVDGAAPCMHAATCPFYNKPMEGTEPEPMEAA